jgi:hypothetical protein
VRIVLSSIVLIIAKSKFCSNIRVSMWQCEAVDCWQSGTDQPFTNLYKASANLKGMEKIPIRLEKSGLLALARSKYERM